MSIPSFSGVPTLLQMNDTVAIGQHLRQVTTVVNRINSGKVNVVIPVTLTDSSATTTVTDARLTKFSGVHFDPMTSNAAAEIAGGTLYVTDANRRNGEWTLTHANNAQTDRQFRMVVLG